MALPLPSVNVWYDDFFGFWSSPTSFGVTITPRVPPLITYLKRCIKWQDFCHAQWLLNDLPYLAMWPRNVSFTGPLFNRLNIFPTNVEACLTKKAYGLIDCHYQLDPTIQGSWQRLEDALIDVLFFLLSLQKDKIPTMSIMELPRDFGYKSLHKSNEAARNAIFASRNAFIALATAVTFAIALNLEPQDFEAADSIERRLPTWMQKCTEHGARIPWLKLLQDSFVCDFTPGLRPGAFVHAWACTWAVAFPAFTLTKTPIWIWWGTNPMFQLVDHKYMRMYMPRKDQIENAQRLYYDTSKIFDLPDIEDEHSLELAEEPVPLTLDPYSGQLADESPDQLLSRLGDNEEVKSQAELERILQLDHLAYQAINDETCDYPPIGTKMFEWVARPGGYARTLVAKDLWSARWSLYPAEKKRFTAHTGEWDLLPCPNVLHLLFRDLVPETQSQETVPSSDSLDQPPPMPISLPPAPATHFSTHDPILFNVKYTPVDTMSVRELLSHRYGYSISDPYTVPVPMIPGSYLDTSVFGQTGNRRKTRLVEKTNAALSRLGMKNKAGEDQAADQAAFDFVNYVLAANTYPSPFHPDWDYTSSLRTRILSSFAIRVTEISNETIYLLCKQNTPFKEQRTIVGLSDLVTILQLVREGISTIERALSRLVDLGVIFKVYSFSLVKPSFNNSYQHSTNPWVRPKGYNFTSDDFNAYESMKERFLGNGETGRAAMMAGGIVWRLSREYVSPESVYTTPRRHLTLADYMQGYLVSSELTTAEEELISGTYYIDDSSGTKLSWWPTTKQWQSWGCDPGYWTPDNEVWFNNRFQALKTGTAQPFSGSEWRAKLKGMNGAAVRIFTKRMESLADAFQRKEVTVYDSDTDD